MSDTSPEAAELRHSIHMKMLEKSVNAKEVGDLTVVLLGFAVSVAAELLVAERSRIRAEVLDEAREWFTNTFEKSGLPWANKDAQYQYEAIMKLFDGYIATLREQPQEKS